MKKHIFYFAAAILSLSMLCGCYYSPEQLWGDGIINAAADSSSSDSVPENIVYSEELKVGYNKTASLNPYKTTSDLNLRLSTLLYDSLVKINSNYEPILSLAESVNLSGTECRVVIKNVVKFSDSSALTADSVISSLAFALAEGSPYKARLSNITAYEKTSENEILIKLAKPDILFENLLDFPIIKITSDETKPIGTGRYILSSSGSDYILNSNENHFTGTKNNIDKVYLVSMPSADAYLYSIKLGTITYHFDDLTSRSTSLSGADNTYIQLNNMVYIGINRSKKFLNNPDFKKAISLSLDRDTLVTNAYSSRAAKSDVPFNPSFYMLSGVENPCLQNTDEANSLLDNLGYSEKNAEGIRIFESTPITLKLLVNSDNEYRTISAEYVKGYLERIGIACEIESVEFSDYKNKIQQNLYDLYIGEIKLTNNMDISSLLSQTTATYNFADGENFFKTAFLNFESGAADIESYIKDFKGNYPFIPLVFRKGGIAYARNIKNNIIANESDIFYNIEEWGFFKQ